MAGPEAIRITRRSVERLGVESGDALFWDRDLAGFGVRVYATGRKVYVVQTRGPAGKPKRVQIGVHGEIAPDEARNRAAEVIDRIRRGEDPFPAFVIGYGAHAAPRSTRCSSRSLDALGSTASWSSMVSSRFASARAVRTGRRIRSRMCDAAEANREAQRLSGMRCLSLRCRRRTASSSRRLASNVMILANSNADRALVRLAKHRVVELHQSVANEVVGRRPVGKGKVHRLFALGHAPYLLQGLNPLGL